MCGIVGAVAQRNIVPILIEGLRRLEYRGYDSCGIAVYADGGLYRARSVARVAELDAQTRGLTAFTGIAHTRWATHGRPTEENAHPHTDCRGQVVVVHNGIIENYEALRAMLQSDGYQFESETDTEVIAHLIDHLYAGDLFEAVQAATRQLHGAYAIAVFSREEPHRIVGARNGSPLVIGLGQGENFLASDALALAGTTDRFIYLEDGDVADLQTGKVWIVDRDHRPVEREVRTITAHTAAVELGPYRHFMQKEIFEQPRAIADTLDGVQAITPALFGAQAAAVFPAISGVRILACGTSFYAGLTAKYWIESIARVPVDVEVASEYRYRDSVPDPNALIVVVSQSGETADTLAALKHARQLGHTHTLAVVNVATSAMARETAMQFFTRAGTEIGVASTKAFTTQLVALYLLAGALARAKGRLSDAQEAQMLTALRHLPAAVQSVLALEPQIIAWAEAFARRENALFLGRGMHYPIALEGAL
ncbi:MAG: glutamine--fructose-6-phosphate transaminase (isomerizing), partial [Thiomonas sp.]